jgi:hypothetical protein
MEYIADILHALVSFKWYSVVLLFLGILAYFIWQARTLKEKNRLKVKELEFKEKELASKNERTAKFVDAMTGMKEMLHQQSMVISEHTEAIHEDSENLKNAITEQTKQITSSVNNMGNTIGNRLLILAAEQRGFISTDQSLVILEDKIKYVFHSAIINIVTKSLTENHYSKTPNKIRAKVISQLTESLISIETSLAHNYKLTLDISMLFAKDTDGSSNLARKLWQDLVPFYTGDQFNLEERIDKAIDKLNNSAENAFVTFKTLTLDAVTENSDLYHKLIAGKDEKYVSSANLGRS